MKSVHLIRHAKSSWDSPNVSDILRPLSKRGEKDAALMSAEFLRLGFQWPAIYCSPALRAQSTIQILADECMDLTIKWQVDDRLYTFSRSAIWSYLRQLNDDLETVLLLGHNPAFTDFINSATDAALENFPTCAYAELVFPADNWSKLEYQEASLKTFLKPKMFK